MTSKWLSVEQAAKAIGVSASTVRRRVSSNAVKWRNGENGRREVLVDFENKAMKVGSGDFVAADMSIEAVGESRESAKKRNAEEFVPRRIKATGRDKKVLGEQKYAPLPDEKVGVGGDDYEEWKNNRQSEKERWPMGRPNMLKPSHLLSDQEEEEDNSPEAQSRRFQKIAGASVLLAQKQADEANEKIAIMHNQVYRMRQMCYMAWASAAVIAVASIGAIAFNDHAGGPAKVSAADPVKAKIEVMGESQGQGSDEKAFTVGSSFDELMFGKNESDDSAEAQDEDENLREQLEKAQMQLKEMKLKSEKVEKAFEDAFGENMPAPF